MSSFNKWDQAFRQQNLFAFNNNPNGILWLKVKALSRLKQIKRFTEQNDIELSTTKVAEQFPELFSIIEASPKYIAPLNDFLRDQNNEWYRTLGVDENKLKSDLRRITVYEWGGDQENSVDQYLVRHYVKRISDLDALEHAAEEIKQNTWNFVRTSWYNNWTSYIIESYFKKHPRVLSAVGEVKSVDFFIDDYPIDLKVTYFPEEYMAGKLKDLLGSHELTWLKRQAKSQGILPDDNLTDKEQKKFLLEELKSHHQNAILKQWCDARIAIIDEAMNNPADLMQWLYQKQSARLFGAENRLFVVLIDKTDFDKSWEMKRAFTLIEPIVKAYLDHFTPDHLKEIQFTFGPNTFQSLADIIFVVR